MWEEIEKRLESVHAFNFSNPIKISAADDGGNTVGRVE